MTAHRVVRLDITYRKGVGSQDVTLEPLPVVLVTVLGCLDWWPTDDRLFGSWFTLNVCLTFRSDPVAAVCDTHTRHDTFTHESGYCCSYGSSVNTVKPPESHNVANGISYGRATDVIFFIFST